MEAERQQGDRGENREDQSDDQQRMHLSAPYVVPLFDGIQERPAKCFYEGAVARLAESNDRTKR